MPVLAVDVGCGNGAHLFAYVLLAGQVAEPEFGFRQNARGETTCSRQGKPDRPGKVYD